MQTNRRKQEIAEALRRLALTHAETIQQFEEALAILCRELDLHDISRERQVHSRGPAIQTTSGPGNRPVADRLTLAVHWRGRSCFLGNTLLFRFFEKLAGRPDRYCPYGELLDDVWGGARSNASIRNVVKRLRDKLAMAGLASVAKAIDGSVQGHYTLRLDRLE